MEQPECFQTRKQDQAKIEPEHPPFGQQTFGKRETAQTVAGPEPIRQAVTANNRPLDQDSASQHSEACAQNDPVRRRAARRTISSQASAKNGNSKPVSLLRNESGQKTPHPRAARPHFVARNFAPADVTKKQPSAEKNAERLVMRCTTWSTGSSCIGCSNQAVASTPAAIDARRATAEPPSDANRRSARMKISTPFAR